MADSFGENFKQGLKESGRGVAKAIMYTGATFLTLFVVGKLADRFMGESEPDQIEDEGEVLSIDN